MALRDAGKRGQSLMELALVLPFFFLLSFGAFEAALMTYSVGAARFATGEAARIDAQAGRDLNARNCNGTCAHQTLPAWPNTSDCDADCEALVVVKQSLGAAVGIMTVQEIDVYKLKQVGGQLVPMCSPVCPARGAFGYPTQNTINRYNLDGSTFTKAGDTPYPLAGGDPGCPPATGRNDCNQQSDFLAVMIQFQYDWKTGLFATLAKPQLTSQYYVRIEPHRYT